MIDPIVKGDLNDDGVCNLSDATMLFYYVAGESTLDNDQLQNADVNGDGAINIRDALRVFQFINGQIATL